MPGGVGISRKRVLAIPVSSSKSRGVDRLLVARPDPALVFIFGRSGLALFAGGAKGARGSAFRDGLACGASGTAARAARRVSALGESWDDVLDFEDTLSQIGLGYGFLYALALRPPRAAMVAFGAILLGVWAAFAAWPLPAADFDYGRVNVSAEWLAAHGQSGFAAHWNKNSNLGWAFDSWFMNLFPRVKPFTANGGGYLTLSFIPTLGTMILGLIAGGWMRSELSAKQKIQRLIKDSKLKVQASIQGESVRVTGAKRDDLQAAMALIKKEMPDLPLSFDNLRD